jgi:trehalose synthase-fused probable maltokinase
MTTADDVVRILSADGAAALTEFISRQRWFAGKARGIRHVSVEDWAALRTAPPLLLVLVNVDGERYYVPLSVAPSGANDSARQVAQFDGHEIVDAHWDPDFGRLILSSIAARDTLRGASGRFVFRPMVPWSGPSEGALAGMSIRPHEGEQSNTSLFFDRALILKSIRRPQTGINPEFEITHALTSRTSFDHVARLAGWVDYADRDDRTATVGVVQFFVENVGDGWKYTLAALHRACETDTPFSSDLTSRSFAGDLTADIRTLGAVTGGLHAALASDLSPDFRPEPITEADTACWSDGIAADADRLHGDLAAARARLPAAAERAFSVLDRAREQIAVVVGDLGHLADGHVCKIRCHGDYHLGQVLKTPDAFLVIDFEGEPARPLAERRRKQAALRDVAGMLRSLNYAVHAVARARAAEGRTPMLDRLERWESLARRAFLEGYVSEVSKSLIRLVPGDPADLARVCAVFELEKAFYEVRYELNNRPDWIAIPLAGISRILEASALPE